MNINEARVLIASVDSNSDGMMSLEEFMEMIFKDDDNLNVNLAGLKGKITTKQYNFGLFVKNFILKILK